MDFDYELYDILLELLCDSAHMDEAMCHPKLDMGAIMEAVECSEEFASKIAMRYYGLELPPLSAETYNKITELIEDGKIEPDAILGHGGKTSRPVFVKPQNGYD